MNSTASVKRGWPTQKSKKGEIKEIVFDDDARREYLTGFRKRNLAKKEARAARAKQKQKEEQLELRRERRKERAQRAAENYAAVERAYHGLNVSDVDLDPEAGPSSATAEPQELEFENEEQLATVTVVEDFEVDPLGEHRPSRPTPGTASHSEDDNPPNPTKNTSKAPSAINGPASAPSAKQKSATSNSSKSKPTTKKRPAYQTKAERRLDKFKQKAKRAEKIEEGKLRQKLQGSGGGHGASKRKKQKAGRGRR